MPVPDPKYKPRVVNMKQLAERDQYIQPKQREIIHKPTKSSTGKFVNVRPNRMYHREMEPRRVMRRIEKF